MSICETLLVESPRVPALLGRPNVLHTPRNAGRTIHANSAFARALLDQFTPAASPAD